MSIKKGIIFTYLTALPTMLMGLVTGVLITRILAEEGKGLYTIFTTNIGLLNLLLSANIGLGMIYFIPKLKHEADKLVGIGYTTILVNLIVIPIFLFIVWVSSPAGNVVLPQQVSHVSFYFLLYFSTIVGLYNAMCNSVFIGLRNFRAVNQMAIINAVLMFVVFVVYFYMRAGITGVEQLFPVLLISLIVQAVSVLFWTYKTRQHFGFLPKLNWNKALLSKVLGFTAIGYLANLLNQLNYRLDVYIVERYAGAAELGLYAVATGVGFLLFQVPETIAKVLQPHMVADDMDQKLETFATLSRICSTVVLVACIFLALVADTVIPLLYGDAFGPSALALKYLLPGLYLACITKILVVVVVSHGKLKYNLWATVVGLVFTIILDLILIPKYGMLGAAVATSAAYAVIFVVVGWFLVYRLGVPMANYFIVKPVDFERFKRL